MALHWWQFWMLLKKSIARFSSMVGVIAPALSFAVRGSHPKRVAIAAAYLHLRLRLALSRRPLRRMSLLGTAVHFIDDSIDLLKTDIEGSEIDAFAELEASGKMPLIRQMFIEYHHHLPGEMPGLSSFLGRLERCGFDYELAACLPSRSGSFQDIFIRAKRND